jgi:DNA polymerase IV (DinB-like DNA polymerase)
MLQGRAIPHHQKHRFKSRFAAGDWYLSRIIGHLDLDYFYAQVEEVENPSFRHLPVLVCVYSGRTEDSGVVSTANYVAREYGVRSAMSIALAKKKLEGIQAIFIPMKHEKYEVISEHVMEILRPHVDALEQTGIDEAFFDLAHTLQQSDFESAVRVASEIKHDILTAEKLTCSIGIGQNKVVAKIASDMKKPDGLTLVKPQDTVGWLAPMAVDKLPGVGSKTAKRLEELGVRTIGDLSRLELESLERSFGHKFGIYLHNASGGIDEEPITEKQGSPQISRIITLKTNSRDPDEIFSQLLPAIDDTSKKILERKVSYRSISTIGIFKDLSIKTRSKTIESPTNDPDTLKKSARELLEELMLTSNMEMRRVGIRVAGLGSTAEQSSLTDYVGVR